MAGTRITKRRPPKRAPGNYAVKLRRLVASQFNRRQHRRVRRNNSLYPLEGVSRPCAPLACTRLLPGQANPLEGDRAIARSLPASPPPRCRRKQRTRPEVPIAPEAAMQREWFLQPRSFLLQSVPTARQNYTKRGARRSERPRKSSACNFTSSHWRGELPLLRSSSAPTPTPKGLDPDRQQRALAKIASKAASGALRRPTPLVVRAS